MRTLRWIVLGATVAVFAGWWFFLRAPGPQRVCDHVVAITRAEAQASGMDAATLERLSVTSAETCAALERDKLNLRGRLKYAAHAKCVVAATTLVEIGRC